MYSLPVWFLLSHFCVVLSFLSLLSTSRFFTNAKIWSTFNMSDYGPEFTSTPPITSNTTITTFSLISSHSSIATLHSFNIFARICLFTHLSPYHPILSYDTLQTHVLPLTWLMHKSTIGNCLLKYHELQRIMFNCSFLNLLYQGFSTHSPMMSSVWPVYNFVILYHPV